MARKTKEAFNWIIEILRDHKTQFQISGGFACNIYGSKKKLADIDLEMPNEKIFEIINETKKHLKYGPKKFKDAYWDLLLMTLRYRGQEIDLCGINDLKIFNSKYKKWEKNKIDLSKAIKKKVYEKIVPVISLENLINYKKKIARPYDLLDIKELSQPYNPNSTQSL